MKEACTRKQKNMGRLYEDCFLVMYDIYVFLLIRIEVV